MFIQSLEVDFESGGVFKIVDETDDQYAKTYLVDRLVIMTSADHGFMSHDLNMGDLINRVRFGEDA